MSTVPQALREFSTVMLFSERERVCNKVCSPAFERRNSEGRVPAFFTYLFSSVYILAKIRFAYK